MAKTKHFGPLAAAAGVLVAVGLLGLMVVLVNPQPAGAAFPGTNGRIAHTGFDGNDYEIFTIPATGGTPFNVTNNNTDDGNPSWQPRP
jgi:hypothetical protein